MPRTVRKVTPASTASTASTSSASTSTAPVALASPAPLVQTATAPLPQLAVAPLAAVTKAQTEQPDVEAAAETVEVAAEQKKRQRPRQRDFAEIYEEVSQQVDIATRATRTANHLMKSLLSAHQRSINSHRQRNASGPRKATMVFSPELIAYLKARLPNNEEVQKLTTETRLHRTALVHYYSMAFKENGLTAPEDGRKVLYQKDPDLVNLLCHGIGSEHKQYEACQQLKNGTYNAEKGLTLFNIQSFLSKDMTHAPEGAPVVAAQESA
jgi:hypothetical protein